MDRRTAIKTSLWALTGAAVSGAALKTSDAAQCKAMPPQTEGPFYPTSEPKEKDNDLTRVKGKKRRATGQMIYLYGRVVDETCRRVERAVVEIWQACHTGRYNHERDPNPAAIDPNFQYWGRCVTDKQGRYAFKSIIPGAYPATSKWMRPPHIHFKVSRRGYHDVTSQLYFAGNPLNGKDLILQNLAPAERTQVIVNFKKAGKRFRASGIRDFSRIEANARVGSCDLPIRSVISSYGDYGK